MATSTELLGYDAESATAAQFFRDDTKAASVSEFFSVVAQCTCFASRLGDDAKEAPAPNLFGEGIRAMRGGGVLGYSHFFEILRTIEGILRVVF